MVTKDGRTETRDRGYGINIYTLLHLKWIKTNKDLLYSTENSAQHYVADWMGGDFGGKYIYVCIYIHTHIYGWVTLMATPETITTL